MPSNGKGVQMIDKKVVADAFGDFIRNNEPWDLSVGITFEKPTNNEDALKCIRCFFSHINTRELRLFDKYIICWAFFEEETSRTGVHIHSLIRGIDPSHSSLIQQLLQSHICFKTQCKSRRVWDKKPKRIFGVSEISPYDSLKKMRYYLGWKYAYNSDTFRPFRINSKLRKKNGQNKAGMAENFGF